MSTEETWVTQTKAIIDRTVADLRAVEVPEGVKLDHGMLISYLLEDRAELDERADWERNKVEVTPGHFVHASSLDHSGE